MASRCASCGSPCEGEVAYATCDGYGEHETQDLCDLDCWERHQAEACPAVAREWEDDKRRRAAREA